MDDPRMAKLEALEGAVLVLARTIVALDPAAKATIPGALMVYSDELRGGGTSGAEAAALATEALADRLVRCL